MSTLSDSTQYGDDKGTASVTWHSQHQLDEFAKFIGISDEFVPIGLRINRFFGFNKEDPIKDKRETACIIVGVLALTRSDLCGMSIPEYFETNESRTICIKNFSKQFDSIDSVLDWFKEIDVVLLTPRLAEMEHPEVQVEEIEL